MILRVKKNWVFLTGIKFKRINLIVDTNNFVQFWAMASGIFSNTTLIVSKLKILIIFTVRDRNLENIQSESIILSRKLKNLVASMQISHNGLESKKPQIGDLSFIKTDSLNNHLKSNEIPILNISDLDNKFNPTMLKITKILPQAVLQENGYYRIMIMFENLILLDNLKNTFLALIQNRTNLIIGSRQNGKYKTIVLELVDKDYDVLTQRYQDLLNICNRSNQFSGKLSIVESKLLEKNFLEYSLGLFADSQVPSNFIEIMSKLPELLVIS